MKKELKQKWIAALRSGKYKQTKSCLRRGNRYCCLGVLCDIANNQLWNRKGFLAWLFDYPNSFEGHATLPPDDLIEEIGGLQKCQWLAEMNDRGCSFKFIADQINAYIKEDKNV